MWRMRPYRGASAEHAATRPSAETDRQGARSRTAAAGSAFLRQRSGRGVDQVEGDDLNLNQACAMPDSGSRSHANGAVRAADSARSVSVYQDRTGATVRISKLALIGFRGGGRRSG